MLSERGRLVRELMADDPARVAGLQLAGPLTDQLRSAIPQAELEQEADWTGSINTLVEDDFVGGQSRRRYFLKTADVRFEVFFPSENAAVSGPNLVVHGIGTGDRIAALSVSPEPVASSVAKTSKVMNAALAAAGPECTTIGAQNTAVIQVTDAQNPAFPAGFTPTYFQQEFFGTSSGSLASDSVNRVVQEMSNGQASVTGQVFGPFNLALSYACGNDDALLAAAIAAADPSIDFTQYRRVAIVFPISSCTYGGLGTIGCQTQSTSEGNVQISVSWLPIVPSSQTQLKTGVFGHEFGHNLGLHHADTDDFGNLPLGRLGVLGTSVEYGDRFSIMGAAGWSFNSQPIGGQYSAAHKRLILGWLPTSGYQEVQSSGTFSLVPYENSSGLRALRILRDPATSSWLWMELRQPLADMDSTLSLWQNFGSTNIFGGALIHYEDALVDPIRTSLLDFTPSFTPNNFLDPTRSPGTSWSDTDSLLTLTVNSANSSGMSVNVTYDAACAALQISSSEFDSVGGSGTITVTAPGSCNWTASSAFGWITLTGATSGTGNGTVPFTITGNGSAVQRNGYITVQRQSIPVVQAGTGLSVISVTPRQGSGNSGQFTFVLQDPAGYQNITTANLAFSDTGLYAPGTCHISISRSGSSASAFLLDDAADKFLSGINLQTSGPSASNSQCTIFSTGSSVTGSGTQLTIILQVTFTGTFSGTHRIIAYAPSQPGFGLALGMWTVSASCGYSLRSTNQSFSAAGGSNTVSVLAGSGCAWTAASNDAWLTVTSGNSGSGGGTVGYSVAANASASARTGTLTVAGQTFTVQQQGNVSCSYALGATSQNFGFSGGMGSVAVTTTAGCAWTATSNDGWLTITSGSSGNGSGSTGFSVATNALTGSRTGTMTIAGQTYTVQQAGSCSFALTSTSQSVAAVGGASTVSVLAGAGCAWAANSNSSWLTITSGSFGNGNGTVGFSIAPLAALTSRTGSLTVAGLTFTVMQNQVTGGSIAQIASGGTWKMILNYLNLGSVAANAHMDFYSNNGGALTLPFTFPQDSSAGTVTTASLTRSLNPGAQLVAESTGPDTSQVLEGWGQLLPTAGITGYGIYSDPTYQWEAVVPLETRDSSRYVLAFDNTGVIATGLAIANTGFLAVDVPVVIRDFNGAVTFSGSLPLSALGHTAFMLAGTYPVTADTRGTIEFQPPAGGHISVLGLRVNGPALTTLPVLADVDTSGGSISHALFNGGFTNSFTLVNTGAGPASTTLNFFDESGTRMSVPLLLPQTSESLTATSLTRTLPAGGSLLVETAGQASFPVTVGSAQMTTDGNVSAFGIFRWTQFQQEASVPLEQRNASSYVLVFDNTNNLSTGLALANVSSAPAIVTVILRNDTGALLQTTSINMSGRGHTSFMLPDMYPLAAGKRGTVEFVTPSGGRISVIGLRATPLGNLTTIPVMAK